jgi:GTP-binding protein
MFIDYTTIRVISGGGGDGHSSFRREKGVPKGGPDGGDGGRGGNIYIEANHHLTTLVDLYSAKVFKAESGGKGQAAKMHGRDGEDKVIKVPMGTVIKEPKSGKVIRDLIADGERVLVARGGRGGRGNVHFKTSTRQAPRFYEKGEPLEERMIVLELKLLADVGIIGLANAGKSTLLSKISKAHPKIADYPFTTLTPVLGIVKYDDEHSFVAADIPGLIEGAAGGRGLGIDFLRHIERTRVYIHVVDPTQSKAIDAFNIINGELGMYDKKLLKRPQVVAINKSDLLTAVEKKEITGDFKKKKVKIDFISARENIGLENVMRKVYNILQENPAVAERQQEETDLYEKDVLNIEEVEPGIFILRSRKVEKYTAMMDFNNNETLTVFRNFLKNHGINDFLREKGVKEGDIVVIGEKDFVFEDDE